MNKEENIINYLYQTWVNIKTMNSAAGQWQKTVAEEIFRSLCRKNNKLNCCYYLRYDSVFVKVYGQFIVYTICPRPRAHKKNFYNILNARKVSYSKPTIYIYISIYIKITFQNKRNWLSVWLFKWRVKPTPYQTWSICVMICNYSLNLNFNLS